MSNWAYDKLTLILKEDIKKYPNDSVILLLTALGKQQEFIDELEKRVATLEKPVSTPVPSKPVAVAPVAIKEVSKKK